jgi:hypothetical protein
MYLPINHPLLLTTMNNNNNNTFSNNNNNNNILTATTPHPNTGQLQCSWTYDPVYLNLLGLIGSIAGLAMYSAPVRDIWLGKHSVWGSESIERVGSAFPYISAIFNCVLWQLYAISDPKKFIVPIFLNTAGFVLNTSFTWCWYRYADVVRRRLTRIQLGSFITYLIATLFIWGVSHNIEIIGYSAAVVNTIMAFSPLAVAQQVIRTRSVVGMPFLPLVLNFISSCVWFNYGLYICNIQAMIPNAFGIIFAIMQLSLYGWAKNQQHKILIQGSDATVSNAVSKVSLQFGEEEEEVQEQDQRQVHPTVDEENQNDVAVVVT